MHNDRIILLLYIALAIFAGAMFVSVIDRGWSRNAYLLILAFIFCVVRIVMILRGNK